MDFGLVESWLSSNQLQGFSVKPTEKNTWQPRAEISSESDPSTEVKEGPRPPHIRLHPRSRPRAKIRSESDPTTEVKEGFHVCTPTWRQKHGDRLQQKTEGHLKTEFFSELGW